MRAKKGYSNKAPVRAFKYKRKKKPKNRNYVRGRAREYYVIRKLLKQGAIWVVRSYGSHGPVDITAIFPDHVKLIQVKKNYVSPKERKLLEGFAASFKAQNIKVELWISKNGRFSVQTVSAG